MLPPLQNDQRVTSTWRESDAEGPPRKYYAITDTGRRALRDPTVEWGRFKDTVDTIPSGGTT